VTRERGSATHGPALVELLRTAARLDLTQADPVVAARNAVGIVLPLAIGALAGNAGLGLASTIGALQTAFADRPGPYRLRMVRMLGTAFAAGVTSALAVVFSRSDIGSAVLLLVLAFGAGLLLAGGPSATQVGVAGTATALVLGHTPQPASAAVHVGLLVFAGGVGQVVLAVAAWPLRRHRPERLALAGLYRELAAAARTPASTGVGPPASGTLTAVRQTLYGLGHDHGPSVEAYRVLLDEAERIRREVIVLTGQAERLGDSGAEAVAAEIREVLAAAGAVLAAVAAALENGRPAKADVLTPATARIDRLVALLDEPATPGGELTRRAAAARARNLAGQLRGAVETARAGASEGRHGEEPDVHGVRRLRDPIAAVRANLTPDSAVLRHAIRLAVLVSASDLVVRLLGVDRGYWVPLTILVVLRPTFTTTFERASMRVIGTIIGLLLATGLLHWVPGGDWYRIALIALFFFGMRLAGPDNLGPSAVALTALIVVLLAIAGIPPHATVVERGVDTLVGGALALAAALLSPVWERQLLPDRLAELLAAYRQYLEAVLDPSADQHRLQKSRAAAGLARSNAQASVDRARAEPVRSRVQVELGEAVLAHTHRFIHGMLTVDAVRATLPDPGSLPELDEVTALAARVLGCCEQAVRSGQPPRSVPRLRPAQERLATALTAEPQRAGGAETAGALIDACDRITDSLDTLVSELRRQLGGVATLTSQQ
jgi:uncharacterized membrane protein YccC